jgi:exopolyphosphatase/guanosine-5'-triphosphate,3'-diphosphate pyrophosphatase
VFGAHGSRLLGDIVTRYAGIDCGTNSIRLLISEIDASETAVDVVRRMEVVRLGEGVDATGRLSDAALERTFAAVDDYASTIARIGVQGVRFAATSATRDAANRDVFVDGVRARLGIEPEVITGTEEAALSFTGATRDLTGTDLTTPYLVVDIGGGSTEFVLGIDQPIASKSVDIGCVRLSERHVRHDPPSTAEVAAIRADVNAAIDEVAAVVDLTAAQSLIGVAGTVTTVVALGLDLPEYDSDRIHRATISAAAVAEVSDRLLAMTSTQRAALGVMHPGRVDVINAGALVLRGILERTGLPSVTASEHDILDGLVWSQLR